VKILNWMILVTVMRAIQVLNRAIIEFRLPVKVARFYEMIGDNFISVKHKKFNLYFLLLLCVSGASHAQTTLLSTDFESPATTPCISFGNFMSNSTFSGDYASLAAFNFLQVSTVDRICFNSGALSSAVDPTGTFGGFSGGFGRRNANTESWALTFDPQGEKFLNVSLNIALVTAGSLTAGFPLAAGDSHRVQVNFFRIPSGQTLSISYGGVGVPALASAGTPLSPAQENTTTITKISANRYQADTEVSEYSLNTSSFVAGDKVGVVFTALDTPSYFVFDNLSVTASAQPLGVAPASASQIPSSSPATLALLAALLGFASYRNQKKKMNRLTS